MAKILPISKALPLAVVGAETLLGREVEDVLKARDLHPAITGYSANGEGSFGDEEGEAVYRGAMDLPSLRANRAVVLAGNASGSLKAYELLKNVTGLRPPLLDCTGALDGMPESQVVAPQLENSSSSQSEQWLFTLAHPAASTIAAILRRLAHHQKLSSCLVHIFEPASERGKKGVAELHEQTASLLAFRPIKKQVYDEQLGFNLLATYGAEAADNLGAIEARLERHLASLLSRNEGEAIPMPSVRLIQAPAFHGYSFSFWVECSAEVNVEELTSALVSPAIEVRRAGEETPTNVGAANQSGLIVGDIRRDRNNSRAVWLWITADNLRWTADAVADFLSSRGERVH